MFVFGKKFILLFVALLFILPAAVYGADSPEIISFRSDLTAITPDEAESGTAAVTFTWETKNLRSSDEVQIHTLVLDEWQNLLPDVRLPAKGSVQHTVPHTLGFDAPTLRLVILDSEDEIVAEEVLVIAYEDRENEPEIVKFSSPVRELDSATLQTRGVNVEVEWEVVNRPANSNVAFKQIFEDGRAVSVELPREFLWIRSTGKGVVRPTLPDGDAVRLQLSLVDKTSGDVYAESEILIPVKQTPKPEIRTVAPKVVFFTSNTQNARPGDTIVLSWETEGVRAARIDVIAATPRPGGNMGVGVLQSFDVAADDSMSFTMGDYYSDSVTFALMLDTTLGAGQSPNLTTAVSEMQAP